MTRKEFAYNMWVFREPWGKILAAISIEGFTPKSSTIYKKEADFIYSGLKSLELDGLDMNKIWMENPVHNTEPIECFIRHIDYLIDKYSALVSDELQELQKVVDAINAEGEDAD